MQKKIVLAIITNNNEILIVRRKEKEGKLMWQFPGGEVEESETNEEAVLREIREETGLNCQVVSCLGQRNHPYTKRDMTYWNCAYIDGSIQISDEDIDKAIWVKISDIKNYFTTDIYPPVMEYLNSIINN